MHSSNTLYRSAVIAALGGFLFGFDTVVISGAEQTIQSLWELTSTQHGWAMSSALWGMVVGSFIGGWPTDRLGRKRTLQLIGVLFFVSAVWSALAGDVYSFSIARIIGGLGVGISTVASPLYISEISPPHLRGRLAGMFQFNIVFGILIAFLSNYVIGKGVEEHAWRWMLGVEAFPALIYTICCLGIPESPRWLIAKRGDRAAAVDILAQVNPDSDDSQVAALADEIQQSHEATEAATKVGGFFSARLKTPILLAFLIAFFNQLSGINAILYFAPRIFGLTGLKQEDALLQSISLGLTNLIFTFVGLYLIDRLGRRTLLLIGSIGYIASLGVIGMTFINNAPAFSVATAALDVRGHASKLDDAIEKKLAQEEVERIETALDAASEALMTASQAAEYGGQAVEISDGAGPDEMKAKAEEALTQAAEQAGSAGKLVLIGILAFIAAHAVGQGAVIWVFISEIFPNEYRAAGQSLGSFTHWIFAALLTMFFPKLVDAFAPGAVFLFFCGMMVLQLLWVLTMVPETKNVPLEEMQKRLGVE